MIDNTMTTHVMTNSLLRCRSFSNLSAITTSGNASTESFERELKRRRIMSPCVIAGGAMTSSSTDSAATTALKHQKVCTRTQKMMNKISLVHSPYNIVTESLKSLCSFDDSFNAICAIENDDFDCFPTIEWKFDDDTDEESDDGHDYAETVSERAKQ
jgi:hypothetical protein